MANCVQSASPPSKTKLPSRPWSWILEAIYESDFLGFSYGFRSQHQALDAVYMAITGQEDKLHSRT